MTGENNGNMGNNDFTEKTNYDENLSNNNSFNSNVNEGYKGEVTGNENINKTGQNHNNGGQNNTGNGGYNGGNNGNYKNKYYVDPMLNHPEIRKFNWSAFADPIFWGIGNKAYMSLLSLIPIFGFFWNFVSGFKGNEWAWQNGNYKSIEEFKMVQDTWNRAGLARFLYTVVLQFILTFLMYMFIMFIMFAAAAVAESGMFNDPTMFY